MTTKTRLVAFSGYARAGKDTAVAAIGSEYERVAFADIMRTFAEKLNPIVGDSGRPGKPIRLDYVIETWGWDGYKETVYKDEIRGLLQRLGTECGRQTLYENVWVDAALRNLDPRKHFAISDCRFVNEANAVRDRDGKVIRIERPGVGPANSHPSETSLDNYDFHAVIVNDGSTEELREKILAVL